jgi:integrase
VVPALGKMKVGSVTREEVERLHRRITAEGKLRRANAVISLVSTLFAQAVTWKMCADLPTRGIKRNEELGRERYLKPDEIERLIGVLDRQRERRADSVDTIMLAMLTGARRGELLGMTWDQLDLDAAVWTKPAAITKQKKMHRVPLSPEAADLLRRRLAERERVDKVVSLRRDNHVFRGGGSVGHIGALERDWRVIRAVAGLEDVRLHDLRHSFASLLVGQGLSLPIIGAMLGHAKSATTQRYAHLADQPLREAAAIVGRIVGGGKGAPK